MNNLQEMRKNVVKEAIRDEHKKKRAEVMDEVFGNKDSDAEEEEGKSKPKKKKHVLDRFKSWNIGFGEDFMG